MKLTVIVQAALLSAVSIPLGFAPGARAQDFHPLDKTTSPPGGGTYPHPIASGYGVAHSSAQPTEATAPAASPQLGVAPRLSSADLQFIHQAAQGGLYEIQAGHLAAKAARSARVRQLGRRLAAHHAGIDEELTLLARSQGATLPPTPGPRFQAKLDALGTVPRAEFDRAYLHAVIQAHRADIALFAAASAQADDPDVRAFAARTLPALRAHLLGAEHIQSLFP